jgi:hypothetical protein
MSRHCQPAVRRLAVIIVGVSMCLWMQPTAARPSSDSPVRENPLERANAYEHGEGVPKDQRLAASLYCELAVAGNAEAAFRLGWMYANGRGVNHDDGTASALFQVAADRGHAFARTALQRFGGSFGSLPDCMRPLLPPLTASAGDELLAGPDPFQNLPANKQKIVELVKQIAPRYGIDPRFALAVIAVESNFEAFARSVKDARGLMQLIPETAQRFNVRNAYDVSDNVRGGLSYLRWLLAYYRGEVSLAVAAYNAGEKAVDRYQGVPPYPETREYVKRVTRLFGADRHPYDPKIVGPSAIAARPVSDRKR